MLKAFALISTLFFASTSYAGDICALKVTSEDGAFREEYRNLALPTVEAVLAQKGYRIAASGEEALTLQLNWNYNGNNELMEWTSTASVSLSFKADSRSAFVQLVPDAPKEFITTIFSEEDSRPDQASVEAALEVLGRVASRIPSCQEAKDQLNMVKREFFQRYSHQ